MAKLGIQKYSKGRYISHEKLVISVSDETGKYTRKCVKILKIVGSPRRENNQYVLVKSATVKTEAGVYKIANKVSKAIPVGIK